MTPPLTLSGSASVGAVAVEVTVVVISLLTVAGIMLVRLLMRRR